MKQNLKKQIQMKVLLAAAVILVMIFFNGTVENFEVMASSKISKPSASIVSRTTQSVNLKIQKVSGAAGYELYRADNSGGSYKKIKTTKTLTYKDTEVTQGMVYYYKVRAYVKAGDKIVYSSFSNVMNVGSVPGKVKNLAASSGSGAVNLSWAGSSSTDSYLIYCSQSRASGYEYLASTSKLSYSDTKIASGKTYYYKVRSYKKADGIKYYGAYSSVVQGKTEISTASSNTDFVSQVVKLVNVEREKAGVPAVKESAQLNQAAYIRAKEIVEKFAHERPDGTSCFTVLEELDISYTRCGENIAYGQKTPEQVVEAWMNSEGHRRNILSSDFGKLGVGYYVKNNTAYWVQLFTNA